MEYVVVALLSITLADGLHIGFGPQSATRAECVESAGHKGYQALRLQTADPLAKLFCIRIDTLTADQRKHSNLIEASQLRDEDFVPEVKE